MNILFLNTTYICGGAEKVTNQIFDSMKARGHHVYEIVSYHKHPESPKSGVNVLYRGIPMLILNRLQTRNHNNASLTIPYSKYAILQFIKEKNIDIVHLHNAHGNFLGIRDIEVIANICPIVWTVHDFWPLTGHCTYPTNCPDLWLKGCRSCEQLTNYPPLKKDISKKLWEEKRKAFSHPDIHFVTPSQWMLNQVKKSHLKNADCHYIPNSLNTSNWIPYDKQQLRKKYQLPEDKKILAFVAADPSKKLKGMHLLLDALRKLKNPEQYFLLIAGQKNNLTDIKNAGFTARHFGYISDSKQMNEFYALADLLINPSLYETFGLVNIEAMASGTPVIAFSICAMEEIISPECGWCIEPQNTDLLSKTIQSAFSSECDLQKMGEAARKRVENIYSESNMITSYENLYKKIVSDE